MERDAELLVVPVEGGAPPALADAEEAERGAPCLVGGGGSTDGS